MKLGKLAPKHNKKTLLFSKYLKAGAPLPPPEKTFWEYKVPPATIGMFGNDTIGDCTCAEVAHHVMLLTAHTGPVFVPEEKDVIAMYSAISGYDPATGINDNGCAITDVLNYWQTSGLSGHKILGWAAVNPVNLVQRNQAVYIFGGCSVGVQLPAIAQDQFGDNKPWEVVTHDGGIEGGHCILESGYGSEGRNFETWGKGDQKASNAWDAKYVDEVYCVVTQDWIDNVSGLSPSHLDMDSLLADLKTIAA